MGQDVTKFMMPTPSNLKAGRARMVDSDLYGICERVREVHKDLYLVLHEQHTEPWVVMEHCPDGSERFVSRYKELGAHILDDLRYMLNVPFDKRLEETQKRLDLENANLDKDNVDMERFLHSFDKAARNSNLYDPIWIKNYRNTKGKKKQ